KRQPGRRVIRRRWGAVGRPAHHANHVVDVIGVGDLAQERRADVAARSRDDDLHDDNLLSWWAPRTSAPRQHVPARREQRPLLGSYVERSAEEFPRLAWFNCRHEEEALAGRTPKLAEEIQL